MNLVNPVNPVKLCAAHTSAGMKITQDVREYAAQKEIDEEAALGVGMKEKAEVSALQILTPAKAGFDSFWVVIPGFCSLELAHPWLPSVAPTALVESGSEP